jgi:hypothetical protein
MQEVQKSIVIQTHLYQINVDQNLHINYIQDSGKIIDTLKQEAIAHKKV